VIIEDDPYWYLQYPSANESSRLEATTSDKSPSQKSSGYPFLDSLVPSYLSVDYQGRVVRLDTFSKTVAPGCRMGWITTQPALCERLLRITETSTQRKYFAELIYPIHLPGRCETSLESNQACLHAFHSVDSSCSTVIDRRMDLLTPCLLKNHLDLSSQ